MEPALLYHPVLVCRRNGKIFSKIEMEKLASSSRRAEEQKCSEKFLLKHQGTDKMKQKAGVTEVSKNWGSLEKRTKQRLGQNIKARREALGYSQEKLALLSEMGVSHLGNIERGSDKNNPTIATLAKIANGLCTSVEKLLEDKGGQTEQEENR